MVYEGLPLKVASVTIREWWSTTINGKCNLSYLTIPLHGVKCGGMCHTLAASYPPGEIFKKLYVFKIIKF